VMFGLADSRAQTSDLTKCRGEAPTRVNVLCGLQVSALAASAAAAAARRRTEDVGCGGAADGLVDGLCDLCFSR